MRSIRSMLLLTAGLTALGACVSGGAPAGERTADVAAGPAARGDLLVSWNRQVLEVAEAEDRFLTLKGLRTATMMFLAVHDALNAIEPRFGIYLEIGPEPEADPIAAAAQAAFEIAVDQYPDQRERFERERRRRLDAVGEGEAKRAGIELGAKSARAILAAREGDGWDSEADYQWQPMAPGVYAEFNEHSGTPEGFIFGAGWAAAEPFALDSPGHFRSPPPPAIDSDEYTRAFNEVKEVGAHESASRTADQSHLAMWWKDFIENSHNRLARQLVMEDGLDLWRTARMFALLNMSIYDAYVCVFDNKFHYNHWRPYTAIRWAAHDGNPATVADPGWDNLHRHTYAFPSYPSAHGVASAAAAMVLADTFGADRPVTMTTTHVDRAGPLSDKMPIDPTTRSFDSFAAAAEEAALSRVYLGIHFRYDSVEGTKLGRKIGAYVVGEFLTPRG